MNNKFMSCFKVFLIGFSMLFLSACATTNALDERDPWEGFNRGIYTFNENMDKILFDHIGKAYNAITPSFLDTGISNFFKNLGQISVIANDLLQFKLDQAANDTVRLLVNSTVGLLGIFDVSSAGGHYSSDEDFGQTLAHWGVGPGPYIVMPLFGSGTVRDVTGLAVDSALNPIFYVDSDLTKAGLLSLNFVDIKSDLLSTTDLIGEAALDEYDFTKNAYFEKRENQINDKMFEDFSVVE